MLEPEIGELVMIDAWAECPGEFLYHGIRPYVQGLVGVVTRREITRSLHGHVWRVDFPDPYEEPDTQARADFLGLGGSVHHQWFAAGELRQLAAAPVPSCPKTRAKRQEAGA